jgi:hypothetical protein
MADSLERQATRKSAASRAASPPGLSRVVSGNHLDDHGYYTGHMGAQQDSVDEASTEGSTDADAEKHDREEEDADSDSTESGSISPEVLDGIEVERDLEAQPSKLERAKSSKSVKDPNLVTWKGHDDPENPKNWTIGRKWAATLVGAYTCPAYVNCVTVLTCLVRVQFLALHSSALCLVRW